MLGDLAIFCIVQIAFIIVFFDHSISMQQSRNDIIMTNFTEPEPSKLNIKINLLKSFLSSSFGKISTIGIRLLQIPLLLSTLGADEYGRWLVISSLPSWLTLANLGFGSVSSNEMSMAIASGDNNKASTVFSTAFALVIGIGIVGTILTFLIVPFVRWEVFVSLSSLRQNELKWTVIYLSISVFFSFAGDASGGRFRAARKAHIGVFISSLRPWFELLLMFIVLQFTIRFDYLAFAILWSTIIYFLIFNWLSRLAIPTITFSLDKVHTNQFKVLFYKGMAFQAFPLGNALLFQGNILVVQSVLGPVSVALFGTTRTLVRSVNQIMELVNQVIWPELSLLFGKGDYIRAARLHRIGVGLSFITACVCVLGLSLFGQLLYGWWTGKTIELPQHLLFLFLLPIPFNALWFTSSVVHVACNKHEGLAIRYLIATCISLVACAVLAYFQGIEGVALSTLVADILLIPYVLKRSILLTSDSWQGFILGIWQEKNTFFNMLNKFINSFFKLHLKWKANYCFKKFL